MTGQVAVSVHDVTPAHEERLRRIGSLLDCWGVQRASLLVVPDFHRAWDLRRHPDFVAWLRQLSARHEIVLHGLEHADVEPGKGSPMQRLVRHSYSREGEFYTLGYESAAARIQRGRQILREVGLDTVGFVAPAWLQNPRVLRAAGDAGLRYATSLWHLHDLHRDSSRRAPVLCYSPRRRSTAVSSVLYCDTLSPWLSRCDLVRIAIHPGDVTHGVILRSLARAWRRHGPGREQVAYEDLVWDPHGGGGTGGAEVTGGRA